MTGPGTSGSWVMRFARPCPTELTLLCLPYAGAGASVYRSWADELTPAVELCAVQLPGREERFKEPLVASLPTLVEALVEHTRALRSRRYVLFGHSMGALLAFELVRALRRRGERLPRQLIVSAAAAPHCVDTTPRFAGMRDAELMLRLRAYGGTPAEVLAHPEMMELLLPALRADLSLRDGYFCSPEAPLDLPITVFVGDDDTSVSLAEAMEWRAHTSRTCALRCFSGGHFFIRSARGQVLAAIEQALAPWLETSGATSSPFPSVGDDHAS